MVVPLRILLIEEGAMTLVVEVEAAADDDDADGTDADDIMCLL